MSRRSKTCFKCEEYKPLSEFYTHPEMGDGHLNKCKECTRVDVQINRAARVEYYRQQDAKRSQHPERKRGAAERSNTYRKENPDKVVAHRELWRALSRGDITRPQECSACGGEHPWIHGHHMDYSRPLDVVWVCPPCHSVIHREGENCDDE